MCVYSDIIAWYFVGAQMISNLEHFITVSTHQAKFQLIQSPFALCCM